MWRRKETSFSSPLFLSLSLSPSLSISLCLSLHSSLPHFLHISFLSPQAYASLKPLGSWTRDLVSRVEQFSVWATTTHPPVLFWLSGFMFPTGFLTAVLQTAARKNNVGLGRDVCVCVCVCMCVCVHVCVCVCMCVCFGCLGSCFPQDSSPQSCKLQLERVMWALRDVCVCARVCVCMCVCFGCLGSRFPQDSSPQSCKLQLGRIMCALRDVCVSVCACVCVLVVWVHVSHWIAYHSPANCS